MCGYLLSHVVLNKFCFLLVNIQLVKMELTISDNLI